MKQKIIVCILSEIKQIMTQPSDINTDKQHFSRGKTTSHREHKTHEAMIKFKETENHVETVKKRCLVLKVQQQKYHQKTIDHQKKILFLEEVKNSIQKDKKLILKTEQQKLQELNLIKEKNIQQRDQIRAKVKSVLQSFAKEKSEQYRKQKSNSKIYETIIDANIKADIEVKKKRHRYIQSQRQNQKMHISRFYDEKINSTRNNKSLQNEELSLKLKIKEKQLKKFATLEQQMIKKNAESIQASYIMKTKLNEALGKKHSSKKQQRFKLPEINAKTTSIKEKIQI